MKLKDLLPEGKDKLYVKGTSLWSAYSPGSGTTIQIKGKKYITDKSGDSNREFLRNVMEILHTMKPLKRKKVVSGVMSIHKIPVYWQDSPDREIWNGEAKPKSFLWLIVTEGNITTIGFFDSKNEALNWFMTSG